MRPSAGRETRDGRISSSDILQAEPDAARSLAAERGGLAQDVFLEPLQGFHVISGRRQAETDRVHAQVRDAAHRPPRRELLHPLLRWELRESHPALDAEPRRITPCRLDVALNPFPD